MLTAFVPSYTLLSAVALATVNSFALTLISVVPSTGSLKSSSGVNTHAALAVPAAGFCVPSFHASVPEISFSVPSSTKTALSSPSVFNNSLDKDSP